MEAFPSVGCAQFSSTLLTLGVPCSAVVLMSNFCIQCTAANRSRSESETMDAASASLKLDSLSRRVREPRVVGGVESCWWRRVLAVKNCF